MSAPAIESKCYCNVLAIEKGLDPVGYAHDFDDAVIVEIPLPWKRNLYQQAGALPQQIVDLLKLWLARYEETGLYRHTSLMIAPDPEYSREGYRRVMFYTRPDGHFASFHKIEYLVPEEALGALVWSLYEARQDLPQFEQYRVPEADAVRDILVCTHGTVDAACAKFGYPLFKHMRATYADDNLRVWRVSHFGGHVFAPTLMDMPIGHYWAYVEKPQAGQIVLRNGDVSAMRGHYRGWAGLESSFAQAAERELWQKYGWEWFDYAKRGEVIAQDADEDNPKWSEVQIECILPQSCELHTAAMRVEVEGHVETEHSTGSEKTHAYTQYTVTRFDKQFP